MFNFFINISSKKSQIISKYIHKIFKDKFYNIIYRTKHLIWKDIRKFWDDIDLKWINKRGSLNVLSIDLIEKYKVKKEKQKEINLLRNSEINNYINIFKNKLNRLPLFETYIKLQISKYNILINKKIAKIINKFDYPEDKINFDSNKIFSFISKNNNIYEGEVSKINEINTKLRELCDIKENKYLNLISKTKPELKIIKKQKLFIVQKN